MEIIYVYSTNTYLKNNWFKIGMTTQDTAIERIKQQDGTSNPEPLKKLYELDIIQAGHDISAYELEQTIHRKLDRAGKRVRRGREWFELSGGIEEVKSLIESILDDTDVHKQDLKLKPHQDRAIQKIEECFSAEDKRCLLNHKPRSGKTFTTLYHIKKEGYKNVAILTSFPILNYQWEETIEDFKGFSNYKIQNVSGDRISKVELDPNKNNIVLLSLQDVKGGDEGVVFEKEKFDLIKDVVWDLVVVDEIHVGYQTEKTSIFMDKIKYERLLGLSATPAKNLICGTFTKEQTHTYTLVEEMELKKKDSINYPYADINFYLWKLIREERETLKYFSEEDQFTCQKLFRIENGEFYYKSDLVYIFRKLIGDREVCKKDPLGTLYPFKNQDTFSGVRSILMFVPSIPIQEKLIQLLEGMDSYSEDFNIFTTNSKIYSSKALMNAIKREFVSKDNKRSLIIAVDQLTTGITLDDCDMVVLFNDWESIDKYTQASFRCQSPRKDKKDCFVLDLNPARGFSMIWEYSHVISNVLGKSTEETLRSWFNCVNVFNRVEGGFEKLDFDKYSEEYNKILFEKPRFNYSSTIIGDLNLVKDQLLSLNISVGKGSGKEKPDDGIDKGKSKKIEKKGVGGGEKKEVSLVKLMEIAKALLDKTMLLTIFTYHKSDKVEECFKILEEDKTVVPGIGELESKMFMDTLLVGMKDVENIKLSDIKFIYTNIYDCDIINRKIYDFNQKIRKIKEGGVEMLEGYINLINDYLKPSTTEKRLLGEVFTPLYDVPGCVNEQLSLIDESFWKNKNVKVLDPCAGIGNYSVVLVDKFMKGLKDVILDEEERLKWILEEIIYINEYQSKNLFIYLMLFDPENKYKMNYNRGDYLKLNIEETFGVDKFDLICMNSPYQEELKTKQGSAKPMYNHFIEKSMKESNMVISINPSRWFAGGKNLDDFRKKMLSLKTIKNIAHIPDSKLIFGNLVDIVGGISYCLIDNSYNGLCNFNGVDTDLSKYDIIVDPKNYTLLEKISNHEGLDKICKGQSYSGIITNDKRLSKEQLDGYIKCYVSQVNGKEKWINKNDVKKSVDLSKWKVITARANGANPRFGNKFIGKPDEICNQSYIVFEVETEKEAKFLLSYLNTNFANFLLSLRKITQDIKPDTCKWIPMVPFDRDWTDQELYNYFDLSKDEIESIEKTIK